MIGRVEVIMGNVVRMTISVPQELKARMDRTKEPVNWSATACQAFQSKLAEIATRRRITDMSGIINRLRASSGAEEKGSYDAGYKHGKNWAEQKATANELRRLARYRAKHRDEEWVQLFDARAAGTRNFAPCEFVAQVLDPEIGADRQAASLYWEATFDDEDYVEQLVWDTDYVHGFCDGALEVWETVKDQI